ncbi:MAG: hypothetical protein Q4A62_05895 [Eikenella sp.]|nr:hypothetical protein [Eikenella sp.]
MIKAKKPVSPNDEAGFSGSLCRQEADLTGAQVQPLYWPHHINKIHTNHQVLLTAGMTAVFLANIPAYGTHPARGQSKCPQDV